ncbi:helix-turn-helix transcriptional regulator [Sporosarcina obsidiansis]|uniref:helix-turn-helix transcriptional regulator n=1 Tax=Sporosarcina obsidiansis TaxID=2660748 RepID=UPI00189101F9|nr:winged helix-turn-helix domain-containing protein [Sporosarcina obsidiansis]
MTNHLAGHTTFTNGNELDLAVRQHLERNWRKTNRTDRAVFELIQSHSGPFLVAHLTQREMEEELGVSNSTIRRVIRKLIKLEMIRRIPYTEPDTQGPGANIYVILPVGTLHDADAG